jgi:subtilisin
LKKRIITLLILTLFLISLLAPNLAYAQQDNEEKRVIITFKDHSGKATIQSHGWKIHEDLQSISAVACSVPKHDLDALRNNPNIASIEEDVPVYAVIDGYDDYSSTWGVVKIGAQTVTATGNTGEGIRVAVIDTGINYNHIDFNTYDPLTQTYQTTYAGGYDFVNKDSDPNDDNGHGTHCAGIIAAQFNLDAVVGVAPKAKIYALKVLNSQGSGYTSDIISAIEWATNPPDGKAPAQVISMSLGASIGSTALQQACYDAYYNHKIVIVAAAGNNGQARLGSNILYPARYDGVIAVGATDQNNVRASFSNTGPELDIVAPGVNILSDYIDTNPNDGPNKDVVYMSGTSMATPHVAGVAALVLKSQEAQWQPYGYTNGDGTWTSIEVTNVLTATADDLGTTGKDNLYGYGIVDADQAALTPPPPPTIREAIYSPASTTLTLGTSSDSPTALAANDKTDYTVKSAKVSTSQTIDWYSTTKITQTPSTVTSLTITYDGSYSTSRTQTLYIYNYATSQWQSINSQNIGTTDVTITYSTQTPANYISTQGEILLRTYASQRTTSSFNCNADFTQITVKYAV